LYVLYILLCFCAHLVAVNLVVSHGATDCLERQLHDDPLCVKWDIIQCLLTLCAQNSRQWQK